ncbi:MAG: DNA repair protein RadC [Bacilli bacterium]
MLMINILTDEVIMSFLVKEMPLNEQPRERLQKFGVHSLATHELLAIILRTGCQKQSAVDVAKALLYNFESIDRLNEATIFELMQTKGIGVAKAIEILAAIELGKRINSPTTLKIQISSPEQSYNFLKDSMQHLTQENLVCLYLNLKSEVISQKIISIGTINNTIFNPRDILKWGLKLSASAIIVAHNHPSGNPEPSMEDVLVTKKLLQASKLVDILIVDHIIIGKNRYYSFLEHNKLN